MSAQIKSTASEVSPIAKIAISASLFASLATLEKAKGQKKLAEQTEKEIKEAFARDADSHACENEPVQWVTESGQLAASLVWQTRETLSEELLRFAGVPQTVIDACKKPARFQVLRTH